MNVDHMQLFEKWLDHLDIRPKTPRVITVAGTNGKGSTVAFLASIMHHQGYRVGAFTSPHVYDVRERITLDGQLISQIILKQHQDHLQQEVIDWAGLSFFSQWFLLALSVFSANELDFLILEVGIGGQHDVVNCIDADCAVITSIGLDHQDVLGDTLEAIALQKFGIARAGCPCIYGSIHGLKQVKAKATEKNIPLWVLDQDFSISEADSGHVHYQGFKLSRSCLKTDMIWPSNVACALMALESMGIKVPSSFQLNELLCQLKVPGRCQRVQTQTGLWVLDGAHNVEALVPLTSWLKKQSKKCDNVKAICGFRRDKPYWAMLESLACYVGHWCLVPVPEQPKTWTEQDRLEVCQRWPQTECRQDMTAAIAWAKQGLNRGDVVLVVGSFYLLDEVYGCLTAKAE